MKKKFYITQQIINIKRELTNISEFNKKFIFDNINYRRHVWNDFVEESKKYDSILDFKPMKFHTEYITEQKRRGTEFYCEGVSKSVSRQIDEAKIKCINRSKNEHRSFELRFKSFDKYRGSFTVDARPTKINLCDGSTRWNTKVNIISDSEIYFRANRNLYLCLFLKEPLFYDIDEHGYFIYDRNNLSNGWCTSKLNKRCRFRIQDIRQVVFLHELGHFYIQLSINMTFINKRKDVSNRKDIAGIDLGIHNPITVCDSDGYYIYKMSNKTIKHLMYLMRRCRRLQGIMDKKSLINKSKGINPHSKNFERVRKKYRKTWRRIRMIRDDWKKKICAKICKRYQIIIVDICKTPTKDVQESLPKSIIRKLNFKSRFYAMSYINEYIEYCALKYGTIYNKSPKFSTRTCSCCGHVIDKIPLKQRTFKCDKCGMIVDRDINASKNCFNYGVDLFYT